MAGISKSEGEGESKWGESDGFCGWLARYCEA